MPDKFAKEVGDIMDHASSAFYSALSEKAVVLDSEFVRHGIVQIMLPKGRVKANIITTHKVEIMSLPPVNDDD